MPPPQGLVKLSRAAADRNLKGDVSNGSYGKDWYSERGGSQVSEGGWASGDDTWMSPELAAKFEGLAAPTTPTSPAPGGPPGGPPGGEAMPPSMGAISPMQQMAGVAQSAAKPNLNPNLGQRTMPESMSALASMGRRAY